MDDKDSDDYELLPHGELEQLRKEIATAKKGSSDPRNRDLHDAIERLNGSINKLISILEDAQQDIIEEYQESKPVEKLNQLLDQNETIARALITINDKLKGDVPQDNSQSSPSIMGTPSIIGSPSPMDAMPQNTYAQPQAPQMQQQNSMPMMQQNAMPQMQQQNSMPMMQQNAMPQIPQPAIPQMNAMPQMNPLPPMNQQLPPMNQYPQMNPLPPMNQQLPSSNQSMYGQYPNMPSQQFQGPDIQFNTLPPLDAPPPMVADQGMIPNRKNKFLGLM